MNVQDKKWIRFRIHIVGIFFISGMAAVIGRAYLLQVMRKDFLGAKARSAYMATIFLPAKRGSILDRDGHEMALSIETVSVYAHPKNIENKLNAAKQLSAVLGEKTKEILKLIESKRSFVWLKRKMPMEKEDQIKSLRIDGIGTTVEIKRYYTGGETASHLLGFVGTDNEGLEGVEKRYESFLKGEQYKLQHMRDARGRSFFISMENSGDSKMCNVYLTIDKDIQYKTQTFLKEAVDKNNAKGGQCIVVDPFTGEVLALAVVPEFNPNNFSQYDKDIWRNRTVTDCFEPGSTIKTFLVASALNEKVVTPDILFDCEQGRFKIGRNIVHDTHEYEQLTVAEIVKLSSNIGAIKIGWELGYASFFDYLKKFGFGSISGVDLMGERSGFVREKKNAKPIDQANTYFGQGMSATSMQLVMAMAAIANGGNLMKPYVVKEIRDYFGNLVKKNQPHIVRRVISEKTASQITNILEGVVDEKGTAPLASIKGFRVAGKTGTSQKIESGRYSKRKYVALFVGFVPVEKPRFVILALIDEPMRSHYGGIVAAPVFKEVGYWSLNHFRINPLVVSADASETNETSKTSDNQIEERLDQILMKVEDGIIPDFKGLGMRDVVVVGTSLDLKLQLEGSGFAVKQVPPPGSALIKGETLKVTFESPAYM